MNKWIHIFLYIALGLFVGSIGTLFYISSHDIAKTYIKKRIVEVFKESYGCRFDAAIEDVNIFNLSCRFRNIQVTPLDTSDGDWFMYIHHFTIDLSWFALLWHHYFLVKGYCEQLVMHETFNEKPYHLADFLKKLSQGPGAEMISYDTLSIVDGVLSLSDMQGDFRFHSSYNANMSQDNEFAQSHIHVQDGYVLLFGHEYCNHLQGSVRCRLPYSADIQDVYIHTDLTVAVPDLGDQQEVVLFGEFDGGEGRFVIENQKGLFVVNPIDLHYSDQEALASLSMVVTPKLLNVLGLPESLQEKISGSCLLQASADLYKLSETVKVDLLVDKVVYNDYNLFNNFLVSVQHDGDHYIGELSVGDVTVSGPMNFKDGLFSGDFTNQKDVSLLGGQWNVDSGQAVFHVRADKNAGLKGSYDLYVTQRYHSEPNHLSGSFVVDPAVLALKGEFDDKQYEVSCQQSPFVVEKCTLNNQDKTLIDFVSDVENKNRLLGSVDFDYVESVIAPAWKSSFRQDGLFKFEGEIKDGVYYAHMHTDDAHIRIPRVYNVVRSFDASAEIDLYNRSVTLKNIACDLYDGDISCKQARALFDENGKPYFIHAPLLFKDVMLSGYKGIFATFSGKLHCEKREDEPFLFSGFLVADKAQLKGNILSKEFQDQVLGTVDYGPTMQRGFDCIFDVHMMTRDGVEVETSFINTLLRGKVDLLGTLQRPEVDGAIYLEGGSFAFPYKSLDIMQGKISCIPGQSFDPFIEVIARGKLKRYDVTMRVLGSMYDQKISFESAPQLQESQIIGLLLVGSEEHSLSAMAPAFLMQSLQDLVFGPAVSKSNLNRFFNKLLKPFKRIRFIPQFTNQTGRGGMRGVIEADVTEKLSGRIDSNFMQLEDTQFEVNYAATDEITFRVLKDGPSTYGGEVEMKWSFDSLGKK